MILTQRQRYTLKERNACVQHSCHLSIFGCLATLTSSNFSLYGQTSDPFPVMSFQYFSPVKHGLLNFIRPYASTHVVFRKPLTRLVNHTDREATK